MTEEGKHLRTKNSDNAYAAKNKPNFEEWGRSSEGSSKPSCELIQRPKWLPQDAWPFETKALDLGRHKIAVTDTGLGPVILFVHTGFWSFIWRDVILRLKDRFRCICFDAPGTGLSDRLDPVDVSLERAARALTTVIESLDLDGINLVVHDLGGPSGIAGAARVENRISALFAVNSFGWRPSGLRFRGMLALISNPLIREVDALSGFLPRITAGRFGIGRFMDNESRKAFLAGIDDDATRAFHEYIRDAHRAEFIYGEVELALVRSFRQLPVCTIFGERNDPFGFQRRWKRHFPNAHQVVVSKGNHFPMCDDPDLVAETIGRLARNKQSSLYTK